MALVVPAAANAHAQSPSEPAADHQEQASHLGALVVLGHLTRALAFAAVTYSFAVTAWQARHDQGDAAFVVVAYAALIALLLLRRAEQLTPASPAGERRRLQAAVWALSTVLSCAFAYRVSLLMPAALVVLVWCMTSFVVLFGFYLLVVLCKYQQHQSNVDEDDECDADSDRKPLITTKIRPSEEMV
ncbi:hypothetical protein PR202_gb24677 [Eleusine coracana subsp. coracana]|uniref:Uncharacterized protein n=1 Tax=Eleusine coracana subsp. coracana TaxID=191504 RepID=A0AAV5FJN7_ELECO|nr:hypothetical protein QOZ80_5BG0451160 [Eleusine coracana subsp. coracana]GJN35864.1 hypothetical protein PR202_gb24677 [Eleusine coracana subsp. coracana]